MRGLWALLVMALKTHQVSLCRQQHEGRWQKLSLAQLPPWGRDTGRSQVEQSSGLCPQPQGQ